MIVSKACGPESIKGCTLLPRQDENNSLIDISEFSPGESGQRRPPPVSQPKCEFIYAW